MDDLLQALAWRDCIRWAINDPDVVGQFRRDNPDLVVVSTPRTPLESLIDQAAGVTDKIGQRFIEWFNENVWGVENVPQSALNASTA